MAQGLVISRSSMRTACYHGQEDIKYIDIHIRAHTLYSTVDGSLQGYSWLVRERGKKLKNKICWYGHVGGRKKI